MVRFLNFAALCFILCAPAQQRPTLDQLLEARFPTELTAASASGKIAWIENHRGVRNIFVAEPPDYAPRAVSAYSADDGQEISSLVWTRNAGAIVFVRGGAANRSGEIPNPMSDPRGAEQAIWVVPAAGGTPRKLAEGSAPAASPKGGLAYLSRGQIWSAVPDGDAKPEQLTKLRGQCGSLRWSPDGALLAFVSNRGDHGFIGVYDFALKTVRFLDPSVDRDGNPVWSPDGRQVAFLRIPASRELNLFGPKRVGEPWSIRVADVNTGRGRQVWVAEPGRGSVFRNVVASGQIFWGAGDRLVFPWERDGWTHLYSVALSGGRATLLTPGEFEVEDVALAPDRRSVLFSSNQDDIDRRHLWRVPVEGGRIEALTRGAAIEWAPVMAGGDGRTLAFLRSEATRPARVVIQQAGAAARDLTAVDFPAAALVAPQAVLFSAADGMRIPAQLFLPAAIAAGERRPAIIFFHGGSRRQMLLGFHYGSYYHNAYAFNQYLASRGYIVLAVNYRSGIGYGMEFREALNYGATGASEFHDVMGAGLYLRSRPDVDPKRIGLWGGSYGGYLTALGLARASDLFACGVDIHGVHDWNVAIRNFAPSYDPQAAQAAARLAFESSPMASVKTWRSPVLLIHGDDDRNVPFSESVTLAEALRKQNVPFEQLIFPDEVHGFLRHDRWLAVFRAAADFFNRHLKPEQRATDGR